MKAVVAAFNKEKALVGAFSVLTSLRMELFQALLLNAPATEPGPDHLSGWLPSAGWLLGAGDRTARPGASAPSPTNPAAGICNVILSHQRGGSHAWVMSYDSCVMKLMVGYSVSFFSVFSFGQFESKYNWLPYQK